MINVINVYNVVTDAFVFVEFYGIQTTPDGLTANEMHKKGCSGGHKPHEIEEKYPSVVPQKWLMGGPSGVRPSNRDPTTLKNSHSTGRALELVHSISAIWRFFVLLTWKNTRNQSIIGHDTSN